MDLSLYVEEVADAFGLLIMAFVKAVDTHSSAEAVHDLIDLWGQFASSYATEAGKHPRASRTSGLH